MRARLGISASVIGLVTLTALLSVTAYRLIFNTFDLADDEGYLLLTLRSFTDGNALYDSVYSQYGPGYYVLVGGAMKLFGVAFTSDGARWVNLALWLASTLGAGLVLLRLTRNFAIAAVGLALTFLVLCSDSGEPLHPGATTSFVLIAIVAAISLLHPRSVRAEMAVLGGLTAVLLTTKVNVGALALISILFALAFSSSDIARLRPARAIMAVVFIGVPFVLMGQHLGDGDTSIFAATVAAGALATAIATLREATDRRPGLADLRWFAGAGAVTIALVCLVTIVLGTSPGGLIDGWLLRPLGHADAAFFPLAFGAPGVIWIVLGLVGATVYAIRPANATPSPRLVAAGAAARIAIGLGIWITLASAILGTPGNLPRVIAFAVPFAWVVAIPAPGEAPGLRFARLAIPSLAILQTLHAYPVPGAQVAWATVLFAIVGGICIADGLAAVRIAWPSPNAIARASVIAASVAVVGFGAWFALERLRPLERQTSRNYEAAVSLDLPGATRQRVPLPQAENLRALTAAINRECDAFVTLPGLNSLYLYTGQTAPEELSSSWMFYLSDSEQQTIVDRVSDQPRMCAVIQPDVLGFWLAYSPRHEIPERPLVRFIEDEFRIVHDYEGYELAVRR